MIDLTNMKTLTLGGVALDTLDLDGMRIWTLPLIIERQPQDAYASIGDTISFTVKASGVVKYQWEFYSEANHSWRNSSASGNATETMYGYEVNEARLGYLFRCKLTGVEGVVMYTDTVVIREVK